MQRSDRYTADILSLYFIQTVAVQVNTTYLCCTFKNNLINKMTIGGTYTDACAPARRFSGEQISFDTFVGQKMERRRRKQQNYKVTESLVKNSSETRAE